MCTWVRRLCLMNCRSVNFIMQVSYRIEWHPTGPIEILSIDKGSGVWGLLTQSVCESKEMLNGPLSVIKHSRRVLGRSGWVGGWVWGWNAACVLCVSWLWSVSGPARAQSHSQIPQATATSLIRSKAVCESE